MKIHLTSCETHETARRHQEQRLRELFELSPKTHQLVENPAEAEIIFIGNVREDRWFESLRRHPIVNRFPNRCYTVSEGDDWKIPPLLPGVYCSGYTKMPFQARYRTGPFELYHPAFKNAYLQTVKVPGYECPKTWLASFAGRRSHPVRDALLAWAAPRELVLLKDTSQFNLFTHEMAGKAEPQVEYTETLLASKFALCPRGAGASTIRLFEAMQLGIVPVILSDHWMLPRGPRWPEFALFVKESEVENLLPILQQHEPRSAEMGRKAHAAFAEYYAPEKYFDDLVEQFASIARSRPFPEAVLWRLRNATVTYGRAREKVRKLRRGALNRISKIKPRRPKA